MKLNETPNELNREARNGINENWGMLGDIANDIKESVKDTVDDISSSVSSNIVNPEGTSFLTYTGKNIFSGLFTNRYTIYDSTDRAVGYTPAGDRTTAIMKIEHGKQYTITNYGDGNRFRVATLKELPNALEDYLDAIVYNHEPVTSSRKSFTFTNTDNANYMVILCNTGELNNDIRLQVEEGNTSNDYELPKIAISDKYIFDQEKEDDVVTVNDTDFISHGKNMFDGSWSEDIVLLYPNNDGLRYTGDLNKKYKTAIIEIEDGKEYTITRFSGGNRFRVALSNDIPSKAGDRFEPLYVYVDTSFLLSDTVKTTVLNDVGAKYLIVYLGVDIEDNIVLQVERGAESSDYEEYGYVFKHPILNNVSSEGGSSGRRILSIKESDLVLFPDAADTQHDEVYSKYDQLVSDHPEYLTRRKEGESVNGVPIYSYSGSPDVKDVRDGLDYDNVKIGISTGIHGVEKNPVFSTYNLLQMMCKKWRDYDVLENLRFNVEFVIVPIVNPDGFNLHQRRNINDVDLNRGFAGLESVDDDLSGKEPETVAIINAIKDNIDVDFWIDYHETGAASGPTIYSTGTNRLFSVTTNKVLNDFMKKYQREYPYFPQDDHHKFGWTEQGADNTTTRFMNEKVEIPTITLEVVGRLRWQPGSYYYNRFATKFGTELLLNVIMNQKKNVDLKYKLDLL